jgi:hypothetical protein
MIELDMNGEEFQAKLLTLEKQDLLKVIGTLRKIKRLDWEEFYRDSGLSWEWIESMQYYTFRASRKIRVAGERTGNFLRLLNIFVNHDDAYER